MRIYLAGPIFGMTDAGCKDWRAEARRLLPAEWETVDPMVRDYRGRENDCVKEIIEGDLLDIRRCHMILANVVSPSWGTAMEIRQAFMWGIPVFGVVSVGRLSPWLQYHLQFQSHDMDEVVASMVRF